MVDTFISASFGAVSGSSNGYLASKQATKEIQEVVSSIPKMKKGNPHKIKQDAKKCEKDDYKGCKVVRFNGWVKFICELG